MILKTSLRDSTSKNTSHKTLRKVGNYVNGRHMGLQSMKYMGKIGGIFGKLAKSRRNIAQINF